MSPDNIIPQPAPGSDGDQWTAAFAQLSASQQAAVTYCDGPQLVIAGAGSGKTRVLTYKIAYLLRQGYRPSGILALTFTNKAANEMKERVARIVGADDARRLNMGTFHSVFARVLRVEAELIGYTPNFTIYDQADSRSLVKKIIKERRLDEKQYTASAVADKISMAKNHLLTPDTYHADSVSMPALGAIYKTYAERCRQANAMDFDDLLLNVWLLFQRHDDIRRKYAGRFQYVLVDEYQDTNRAQQAIVAQLAREHGRVCVVGDDAQSIYAFRGADIDNILDFTSAYEGARLFKLEQNYRSTKAIVAAANSLIRHNERQIPKAVYSENEQGDRLSVRMFYSDKEEAASVCRDIDRLRRADKCRYADFAILYRTNSQSRSFEEEMRKSAIPYRVYGGLSFYQRKEIKDIIAYFRLVANPNDEEAFRRVVNYPTRGIGQTTVSRIADVAARHAVSLWQVAGNAALYGLGVSKATAARLASFCQMVSLWTERAATEHANLLGREIIKDSGIYQDIYSGSSPEDVARQENLVEFFTSMDDFVNLRLEDAEGGGVLLTDFLQEVALLTDLDSDSDASDDDRVTLMTIHSAKGLEFPTVFVVGMEENIFPSPMSSGSARGLEEERRLFYVAITRAERRCILTCAQCRFRYGRMESSNPSRFLGEIDSKCVKVESTLRTGASGQWDSGYGRGSDYGYGRRDMWQQNPRPVGSQFMADPMRREVAHRREQPAPSPFSPAFAAELEMARRGLKPLGTSPATASFATTPADDKSSHISPATRGDSGGFAVGDEVQHQRFGLGVIENLEGSGENLKAKVCFRSGVTKQLLVKFARLTVVKRG